MPKLYTNRLKRILPYRVLFHTTVNTRPTNPMEGKRRLRIIVSLAYQTTISFNLLSNDIKQLVPEILQL